MRIIAYSSGAWPCGIADYHLKLTRELPSGIACETVKLPTDTVHRDRPLQLLARRRHYAQLAERSRQFDVALVHFITHWNNNRDWEFMLPVFARHLRRPYAVVLHEYPSFPTPPPSRSTLRRLVAASSRRWDTEGFDREDWVRAGFLRRAGHIFVHSEALRDRLLHDGIPADRVSFALFPVADLRGDDDSVAGNLQSRFAGQRIVVVFGFPHPRKSLDRAIRALPQLPPDVILLFVGGLEGDFRQRYVESLLQLARELGVSERAHFIGEVPEASLRAVFELAQLALAPFAYATGSSSLAHLMAAGIPIVASDLPEHELLHREGAGITLFEGDDQAALVSSMKRLLDDPAARQDLSAKSQTFVRRYGFTSFANAVVSRMRQLSES